MTQRTPRVLFVGHVARLSGGELALLRVLPALRPEIDPVVVLGEDGPLVERLRELGVEVHVLPMAPTVRDARRDDGLALREWPALARYVVRLRRLIRRLQPDVVHTNTLKAALYGGLAARWAGVPVVWHVRDRIAPDYLPARAVRLIRLVARHVPDAVLTNSAAVARTLPGVPSVIAFDVAPPPVADVRAQRATPVVGMAGRLAPWKGQELFLRAFAAAFPDTAGDPARAVIIGAALFGEHDYADGLPALADTLGIADRVEFRGFRTDMTAEYARLDMLVHCSLTAEPYGQVVLEGMAAGLFVLAADEGGPREVVTDGVDGVLVRPQSETALADALRRWARDRSGRDRIAHAGHQHVTRLQPRAAYEPLLDTYHRLSG